MIYTIIAPICFLLEGSEYGGTSIPSPTPSKLLARCSWSLSLYSLIAVYQLSATSGQATGGPGNKLFRFYVCRELGQTTAYLNFKERNRFSPKRVPFAQNRFRRSLGIAANESRANFTVCSSKGQALQFTYGLDFLSTQTWRLWMENPSRGKLKEEAQTEALLRGSAERRRFLS